MNLSLQLQKNKLEDTRISKEILSSSYNEPLLMDDDTLQTFLDLNQIQKNLAEIVDSQQQKIDTIENNIIKTEIDTQNAIKDLQEADRLFFSYKPIIIGGLLGGLVGGPIGAAVGVKWMGISGGVGTLLGSYTGYKVQKN